MHRSMADQEPKSLSSLQTPSGPAQRRQHGHGRDGHRATGQEFGVLLRRSGQFNGAEPLEQQGQRSAVAKRATDGHQQQPGLPVPASFYPVTASTAALNQCIRSGHQSSALEQHFPALTMRTFFFTTLIHRKWWDQQQCGINRGSTARWFSSCVTRAGGSVFRRSTSIECQSRPTWANTQRVLWDQESPR